MLTFQEKLAIMSSFPELERKDVSMGRVNFSYERSAYDKKIVGYHFHPNGNGFVYAGRLAVAETDDKGFVNIREYGESELRELVAASIRSLTGEAAPAAGEEERWLGPDKAILRLTYEDEMWYIFSGLNLEAAFETREEALDYLQEEGFSRV
jgi:hypothetical protein